MSSEVKREVGCFSADFLDGTVSICGLTFPSGHFFVNAMNEYWKPYDGDDSADFEIAQKLLVFRFNREKVQDELALGFLYPDHAEKLYDDVQYFLRNIERAVPFCYLDMEAERQRCRRIFGAENVAAIVAHLREGSQFNYEHDSGWANHALPEQSDVARFRVEEARLREFLGAVTFYDELGRGMVNAYEIGKAFVAALERPVRRAESNLLAMAQECIAQYRPRGFIAFEQTMRVGVEYVAVPRTKNVSEVGRRMTFERFGDFLLADFFEGLHAGHYPLRCGVCKQYFLQTTASRRKYCDGYAPNDPKGRSCVAFAARSNRLAKERAPDHRVKEIYNTRRGTINKHLHRGKITPAEAAAANRHIEELLDRAMADNEYYLTHYAMDMELDAVYAAVGVRR